MTNILLRKWLDLNNIMVFVKIGKPSAQTCYGVSRPRGATVGCLLSVLVYPLRCYCWAVCLLSRLVSCVLCPGATVGCVLSVSYHLPGRYFNGVFCPVLSCVLCPGRTVDCVLSVSMYPLRCYFWVLCPGLWLPPASSRLLAAAQWRRGRRLEDFQSFP